MPALPNVPNVIKARLNWQDSADLAVYNTLFFQYSGSAPSSADITSLAAAIDNAVGDQDSLWQAATVLLGCECTDLSSSTAAQGSDAVAINGIRDGNTLAGGTAVVVNYRINRRYRGGKPRNYFPWLVSQDLTNRQLWSTAAIEAVEEGMAAIFTAILGTTAGGTTLTNHVNVSYYEGFTVEGGTGGKRARNVPTVRTTPLVDTIQSLTCLSRPGSQRRRNK
jgi:hypothetical protein